MAAQNTPRLPAAGLVKPCSACGETKPLEDFNRQRAATDGRQRYCTTCKRAYDRAYREAHRERIRAQKRAYRRANPETVNARNRAYRSANPEKVRVWQRAYREARRPAAMERSSSAVEV